MMFDNLGSTQVILEGAQGSYDDKIAEYGTDKEITYFYPREELIILPKTILPRLYVVEDADNRGKKKLDAFVDNCHEDFVLLSQRAKNLPSLMVIQTGKENLCRKKQMAQWGGEETIRVPDSMFGLMKLFFSKVSNEELVKMAKESSIPPFAWLRWTEDYENMLDEVSEIDRVAFKYKNLFFYELLGTLPRTPRRIIFPRKQKKIETKKEEKVVPVKKKTVKRKKKEIKKETFVSKSNEWEGWI